MTRENVDVPVLIVGGGPTGLLQAHLLANLGGAVHELYQTIDATKQTDEFQSNVFSLNGIRND